MKLSFTEGIKSSSYIRLSSQPKISHVELDIAFSDFTYEIYLYCISETDRKVLYFSINHLRTFLIDLSEINNNHFRYSGGIAFLESTLHWIETQKDISPILSSYTPPIVWTGKIIHLMEIIYGSFTLKDFNNGNTTIKDVAKYLGKVLGIDIKDPSGCYINMRDRINESRTVYLDNMRKALLARMDEDDEKKRKRG